MEMQMDLRLRPQTEPGAKLAQLAEAHAADFAVRVPAHDREGTFPFEHLAALKSSGYLYAPIPAAHGGMGVDSVHDVFVASSRLAEGDPSVTVGVNMHLLAMAALARSHAVACAREDAGASAGASRMEGIVGAGAVIGAAVSEPEQDLLRPKTTARVEGGRWVVRGRKIISSLAPAATHFAVAASFERDGEARFVQVLVPRDAPGVTVHDDWDALGVRASGSVSVTFDDAPLPFPPGHGTPCGVLTAEYLEQSVAWGAAHASVSLGIAEAAHREPVTAMGRRLQRNAGAAVRGTAMHVAAENAIDLAAARAILGRALSLIDAHYAAHPAGYGTLDEAHALYAEVQVAKTFVNQAAVRIADRAMTLVGGGAFMSAHPLSRLYRDARAGAFMQPLGANLAYEYVGAVALGLQPTTF
jgi:alkylation response protein AidB-like acyl-CoA dehydrogenase